MFELTDDLFKKIKDYINVTWAYDDEQIRGLVDESIAKIEIICGATDFAKPFAFALLKDAVRYAWNGQRMFFEVNFQRELLQLQLSNATEVHR